jgi:hypothetical protein
VSAMPSMSMMCDIGTSLKKIGEVTTWNYDNQIKKGRYGSPLLNLRNGIMGGGMLTPF